VRSTSDDIFSTVDPFLHLPPRRSAAIGLKDPPFGDSGRFGLCDLEGLSLDSRFTGLLGLTDLFLVGLMEREIRLMNEDEGADPPPLELCRLGLLTGDEGFEPPNGHILAPTETEKLLLQFAFDPSAPEKDIDIDLVRECSVPLS